MDKKRKAGLRELIMTLQTLSSAVENLCDQEQDSMDNTPENLQNTERFSKMEENVDDLTEAQQHIDDALDLLREVASR